MPIVRMTPKSKVVEYLTQKGRERTTYEYIVTGTP